MLVIGELSIREDTGEVANMSVEINTFTFTFTRDLWNEAKEGIRAAIDWKKEPITLDGYSIEDDRKRCLGRRHNLGTFFYTVAELLKASMKAIAFSVRKSHNTEPHENSANSL